MKFGRIPIDQADGAVLAHSVRSEKLRLSKGRRLSSEDIAALREAGVDDVVAAVFERGDIGEDEAARRIAAALEGEGFSARKAATGRANLHCSKAGVLVVDKDLVDRLNAIDPAITLATLDNYAHVRKSQMIATVKIIPFAVREQLVVEAENLCASANVMRLHGFSAHRVGLVQTTLEGTKQGVLDKTAKLTAERLARSESEIVEELRIPHRTVELAATIRRLENDCDLIIVFGASATSDSVDVIPASIEDAGGTVIRVGMPVDPGNLITLGRIGDKPVLGAPGCARSPKENGFDWVLDRLTAGIDISGDDIAKMGVGGLLTEIASRPRPREAAERTEPVRIHAVLLAAGKSSRMGDLNKLLAEFSGVPLVRRSAEALLEAKPSGLTIVTGHQKDAVAAALEGIEADILFNADYNEGLSSSLKKGLAAVTADKAGLLVALADMPGVTAADYRRLMTQFEKSGGSSIVRATHNGKRGNPVILPRSVFPMLEKIEGDMGARQIVESDEVPVIDVEIGEAASLDVDTPERLVEAGGVVKRPDVEVVRQDR